MRWLDSLRFWIAYGSFALYVAVLQVLFVAIIVGGVLAILTDTCYWC